MTRAYVTVNFITFKQGNSNLCSLKIKLFNDWIHKKHLTTICHTLQKKKIGNRFIN